MIYLAVFPVRADLQFDCAPSAAAATVTESALPSARDSARASVKPLAMIALGLGDQSIADQLVQGHTQILPAAALPSMIRRVSPSTTRSALSMRLIDDSVTGFGFANPAVFPLQFELGLDQLLLDFGELAKVGAVRHDIGETVDPPEHIFDRQIRATGAGMVDLMGAARAGLGTFVDQILDLVEAFAALRYRPSCGQASPRPQSAGLRHRNRPHR
jgi:hypothetical protein